MYQGNIYTLPDGCQKLGGEHTRSEKHTEEEQTSATNANDTTLWCPKGKEFTKIENFI